MGAQGESSEGRVESIGRSISDIPEAERAKEILAETKEDLHDDPEGPAIVAEGATAEAPTAWRPAKCLVKLKVQLSAAAPKRSKASDGMIGDPAYFKKGKASDHNPWVKGGVVTAFDVTQDPGNGCHANAHAESIRTSKNQRVKYLIWKRKICSSEAKGGKAAWEWRDYRHWLLFLWASIGVPVRPVEFVSEDSSI